MRFVVGGRPLNLTAPQVAKAMEGVEAETIRTHVVEIRGAEFPPKQVLASVTGWSRQSFTTMEAQRVLARLGFVCRRAPHVSGLASPASKIHSPDPSAEARIAVLESALATAQVAIAGLQSRVDELESKRPRISG